MQHFEENEIRIAAYFDGKMNPAEEEAFMRELADNPALCGQYENELLMRGLFNTGEDELITDDDISSPQNDFVTRPGISNGKKKPALLKSLSAFKKIAAALLVIAAISIILMLVTGKRSPEKIAEIPLTKIDSVDN
ncbi:MAG: hypothetical protein ABI707_19200, partial [Ferruginibacter sp.]